ncbi:hypothetical protein [Streptomyces sp. NPDC058486]|uniref:hypothetical protein n=1 Tax=unclassified Streptomyces TaxID=2593676 RepID=UPI0036505004
MTKSKMVLRRRSLLVFSMLFTLVILVILADVMAEGWGDIKREDLQAASLMLEMLFVIWRFAGSRILLLGSTVKIVNPLLTYTVPVGSVRSIASSQGLSLATSDGREINSMAFGRSLIDHFVGTSTKAADRIERHVRRRRNGRAGGVVERALTWEWRADVFALAGVACLVASMFIGS